MQNKNAILSIDNPIFTGNAKFKQLSLYFENLYLNENYTEYFDLNLFGKHEPPIKKTFIEKLNEIDFLINELKIIKTYPVARAQPKTDKERKLYFETEAIYHAWLNVHKTMAAKGELSIRQEGILANVAGDIRTRFGLLELYKNGINNVYPIYNFDFPFIEVA